MGNAAGTGGAGQALDPVATGGAGSSTAGQSSMAGASSGGATGNSAAAAGNDPSGAGGAIGTGGVNSSGGTNSAGGTTGGAATGDMVSACPGNLLLNGGFESGIEPWVSFSTGTDPLIYDATQDTYEGVTPHGGQRLGWLGGVPSETNRLSQTVSIPSAAARLGLQGSLRIQILEEHSNVDILRIRLVVDGQPIPVAEFTNGDVTEDWFDFAPMPLVMLDGQAVTVTLEIESEISAGPGTNFYVDDLALVCLP